MMWGIKNVILPNQQLGRIVINARVIQGVYPHLDACPVDVTHWIDGNTCEVYPAYIDGYARSRSSFLFFKILYNYFVMDKKFQRKIENFTCEHCGKFVKGNGYTNHCPFCLYSKHVDVNPGDRANTCGGLMKPVGVEMKSDGYILTYCCEKCGIKKKNKADKNDDFDQLVNLAESLA